MTHEKKILTAARKLGVIRPRDVTAPRTVLTELVDRGLLEKSGRGLYRIPSLEPSEHHSLLEVSVKVPSAVISLLSALQFHEIGNQNPSQIWITIDIQGRKPSLEYPSLRVFRASGRSFISGIEKHKISGREVQIYSVEKTIIDCFKYRSKVGLDVAIEALKDGWATGKIDSDLLWKYAKICRVTRVIRPYVEMLS